MKYKVGDKVKIISREKIEKTFFKESPKSYWFLDKSGRRVYQFCDDMLLMCGKWVIISEADNNRHYKYSIKFSMYGWCEEFFEKKEPIQLEFF
jgi:hypothetical protein